MRIDHDNSLAFSKATLAATVSAPRTGTHFSQFLNPHDTATDRIDRPQEDESLEAARSLVSIGLIQPLLSQIRKDPFRSELFHGGQGEEAFGAKLDTILAERITQASNLKLVDAVHQRMHSVGTKVNTQG